MKTLLAIVLAAVVAFAAAWLVSTSRTAARFQAQLADQQKNFDSEKSRLDAALKAAQKKASVREAAQPSEPAASPAAATSATKTIFQRPSPQETLDELVNLKLRPGPRQADLIKQVIQHFESLVDAGEESLPVIRAFLAKNLEFDYEEDTDEIRSGWRDGRITMDYILAPSLRLGLLGVTRRIGGAQAEAMLNEVLSTTGRGVELAYVARLLEEMAPGKYRDGAIASARDLLQNPLVNAQGSRLDRFDRNWLFALLGQYKDTSLVSLAQQQLIGADGKVDYTALRYLRDGLGEQSVPILHAALKDPRLADARQKEPLLQIAAGYTGANAVANSAFSAMMTDATLPHKLREEGLRSLAQGGFENRERLTDRDLQLVDARLSLLASLAPSLTEKQLMQEADRTGRRLIEMATGAKQKRAKEGAEGGEINKIKKP